MTKNEATAEYLRVWRRTPKGIASTTKGNADARARRKSKRESGVFKSASVQSTLTTWGSL